MGTSTGHWYWTTVATSRHWIQVALGGRHWMTKNSRHQGPLGSARHHQALSTRHHLALLRTTGHHWAPGILTMHQTSLPGTTAHWAPPAFLPGTRHQPPLSTRQHTLPGIPARYWAPLSTGHHQPSHIPT